MSLFFAILKGIWGHLNITFMGVLLLSIRKIGGEKYCEFNRTIVSPFFCRLILLAVRMRVKILNSDKANKKQTIYMYNHNSFFDIFSLPLTGLRNTRYIFTEKALGIKGLQWANFGNDALLLPSFKKGDLERLEQRNSKFKEFTEILKNSDTSILTAPEGQHKFAHRIDRFNDGVFKMATESSVQIIPVFIGIEKESNPFEGYKFKPGQITIEYLDPINTSSWELDNLESNKAIVREVFVKKFNEFHKVETV